MELKGGRLEFLVPHLLRGQMLRRNFVRLSLRLGVTQQMPAWAKLQFLHAGVSPADLAGVLRRIRNLRSWVDEWESLGRSHEQSGQDAEALGRRFEAAAHYKAASAAYNFAQYVVFMDVERKRSLHRSCVRAYAKAAPLFEIPAQPFEVMYRRRPMRGYLRLPPGPRPCPVVVMFNGTNAVKEELHWWSEEMLDRGVATILFDGPGMGQTFHRLSMVAEPRPVGVAIMDEIETRPELDPGAVVFFGMSLGGYMAIRMASHEHRIRAVAAVSPPYSASIYWRVTLAGMRRELAALYGISERAMTEVVDRITLEDVLGDVQCPLMIAGGGRDFITPGTEAWRIYDGARCEREIVYYPRGAHDCFNVLSDLRPRMVNWLSRHIERHRTLSANGRVTRSASARDPLLAAGGAVDPDFADALRGDTSRIQWHETHETALAAHWQLPWRRGDGGPIEIVHRHETPGLA
jgi:alpha-beta hydrolase superfamily lysophospholipase